MKTFDKAKWSRFALLVMGGGTIYKLANLKDVFYVPMQEHLGLSNTEIGMLLSVNSIVATALFVVGGYLADRFQTRNVIALGLVSAGAMGLYMSTFPGYNQLLVLFAMLAISSDCLFWPALLKSVRALGDSKEQGRMFGFLEGGRGVVDTLVAFSALGIFIAMGSGMGGFRAAIVTYSLINIGIGVLLFFLLGKPAPGRAPERADAAAPEKKPHVLDALKQIAKLPQLWLVSATVFMVYIVYVGLTYFIPYLSTVYGLPIALVGVFGIINQYGLKIAGGPLGGPWAGTWPTRRLAAQAATWAWPSSPSSPSWPSSCSCLPTRRSASPSWRCACCSRSSSSPCAGCSGPPWTRWAFPRKSAARPSASPA